VAAARALGAQLVSCDIRNLVSRGLASLPGDGVIQQSERDAGLPRQSPA
jgi:hypothetical protein